MKNYYVIQDDTVFIHLRSKKGIRVTAVSRAALRKLSTLSVTWYMKWESDCSLNYVVAKVRQDDGSRKIIRLHRFLSECSDEEFVLHRDGDTLNNRYENLMVTDRNSTGGSLKRIFKSEGVGFDADRLMWFAVIKENGSYRHIGYFLSEAKAAEVYREFVSK